MKTRLLPLIVLALAAIPCSAQSTFTPFSWTTIAGSYQLTNVQNGYGGFADGTNGDAQFGAPYSVAVDLAGNVYVGDAANYAIRKVTPAGAGWVVTTLAELPSPATLNGPGFGNLTFNPLGVAVDKKGNVYVADSYFNSIREITPDGTVSTLAGNPALTNSGGFQLGGYLDGPASLSLFVYPTGVAVDNAGNLYVADSGNNVIRKISLPSGGTGWQVTTLAGNSAAGFGYKDGPGANAQFYGPAAVAVDGGGNVYVADFSNNMIRKVTPEGVVSTLAGQNQTIGPFQGVPYGNADGTGANAQFFYPYGVAVDSATNVYVADTYNSEIRKVTPQGVVTTLGGAPKFGFYGPTDPQGGYQDGTSAVARFHTPTGVAVDLHGNVYVADDGNFVIREGVAPKVQAVAMEVTQVIQDWSNSVPLIKDKETYVRVHLQLPPRSSPVLVAGALLYGVGPNGALPYSPISPINPGGSLSVQNYNATDSETRGLFTNSLNFRLPAEWLSGPVTLRCAWSGGLDPINVLTTDCVAKVNFVPAAVPQIRFFDVVWTNTSGAKYQVGPTLYDLPRRVLSCYPVASVAATFGSLHYSTTGPPDFEDVNSALGVVRYLDVLLGEFYSNPLGNTIYFGAISTNGWPPLVPDSILGLAVDIPSFVSSSLVPAGYGASRQTVSHEIGHNLGRQHDVSAAIGTIVDDGKTYAKGECGEEGLLTYVYPLFQIFGGELRPTLGPIIEGDNNSLIYGLDALTLRTVPALEPVLSPVVDSETIMNWYFDLMSYCSSGGPESFWPSSVTYPALLASNNATFGPPAAPILTRLGAGGGNYLMVRGSVDFNAGTARFLPCLELTTTHAPPAATPGTNFLLEALDASGAVLQSVPFALNPSVVEENDTNQTADFFALVNDNPAIQTLQLSYNGALPLATLTASRHAPTLTLTTPNGGQHFAAGAVGVAWSGSDVDGDPLTYTVQYSRNDGASWQTIAVDWLGPSIELDSSELAATTNGLMRVIASDGFHSTTVQSASTFTVQPHAPMLNINSPHDGSAFIAHQQLFLDATAIDLQDGVLKGTNVQWSSDLDGALGSGAIVTFDATVLSEGYHTITVTAIDSAGLTNSASTHLLYLQYPPPELSIQMSPAIPGIAPASAILSWPSYYDNYVLQGSASLTSGWGAVTNNPPTVQANQQVVNIGLRGAASFYRLLFQP